jgi:predicted nucleotidyltransferase
MNCLQRSYGPKLLGVASALPRIALQLDADERTLRRAVERGAVRARRPSPRALELAPGELAYLRSHWTLLSRLTQALRHEPNVELAVLYGSAARGDEHRDSDVDVLVSFRRDDSPARSRLARRLEEVVDRPVDVARFSRVRKEAPQLLLNAIDDGRVLVDRTGSWPRLRAQRETIARAARRQRRRNRQRAADSIAQLT